MKITHQTARGQREYQEDRYIVQHLAMPDGTGGITVLAVMDGHGGSEVAEYLKEAFIETLMSTGLAPRAATQNWRTVLASSFTVLAETTKEMAAGSTLSVVLLPDNESRAYVAVIGDSPVVIKDAQSNLNIGPEHNAISNAAERDAAISRGAAFDGTYLRSTDSGYGLQMSRALGDNALDFLYRVPEIYEVGLNDESFIIVASDGLFDPAHADTKSEIERIAELVENGADAQALVQDALHRRTGDNVTAVVATQEP